MPSQKKKLTVEEVQSWDTDDVRKWLGSVKLEQFQDQFRDEGVTGDTLLEMTSDDLKEMGCSDKKKKAMKKALGALPGNSVSKKSSSKPKKPSKSKGSGIPPPSQAAPPPPPLPMDGGAPPRLPPSSTRPPMFHQQRPPIPAGPPSPGDEDLYDDPSMAALDYEASVPGPPPLPGRVFMTEQPQQNHGYIPQEPSDIYDCVDEMEGVSNSYPPHSEGSYPPPPPIPPPQGNGYMGASAQDVDEEQDIYIEGDEPPQAEDSFESSHASDDYLSPIEDEEDENAGQPKDTDAIRMLKGRFFAHGLTKGLGVGGSPSSLPRESHGAIHQEEEEDDGDEGDIYDVVPEMKDEYQADGEMEEEEVEEDIYDIPPEQVEDQSFPSSYPPPIHLPPKPKLGAPISAPVTSSLNKPPPPPLPPSHDDEEEEEGEDIYDEGGGGDGYMEDLYDIPSEVEQARQAGFAPPPPPSPPRSPSPFDDNAEDIYDMGDDMGEPPVDDSPPLPARPPKKPGGPSSPSLPISRSPVGGKPQMKKPIGFKAPAAAPPPLPPMASSSPPPLPPMGSRPLPPPASSNAPPLPPMGSRAPPPLASSNAPPLPPMGSRAPPPLASSNAPPLPPMGSRAPPQPASSNAPPLPPMGSRAPPPLASSNAPPLPPMGSKPPAAPPPPAESPKISPKAPPLPPPLPQESNDSGPSWSSGGAKFKKPMLNKAPITSSTGPPPPRPPAEAKPITRDSKVNAPGSPRTNIDDRLARLSKKQDLPGKPGIPVKPPPPPSPSHDHTPKQSPMLDRSKLRRVEKPDNSTNKGSEGSINISEVKLKAVSGRGGTAGKSDPSKTNGTRMEPAAFKPPVNCAKPIGMPMGKLKSSTMKPTISPKTSRISNLMKQFETNKSGGDGDGSGGSAESSTVPSPMASPSHSLPRPPPPPMDVSPMSGRKMDRKNSVSDGIKKFGGGRSPSPDMKPHLPPRPGDGQPSLSTNSVRSTRSPSPNPLPVIAVPKGKGEEKDEDKPPSCPPPARPNIKKGRPLDSGPPPSRPPLKKTFGPKPPSENKKPLSPKPKEQGQNSPRLPERDISRVASSSPGLRKRGPPAEPEPQKEQISSPDSESSSPKGQPKKFTYKPFTAKGAASSDSVSPVGIPTSSSQEFSRPSEDQLPNLPNRIPPPAFRAPAVPDDTPPSLPGRIPGGQAMTLPNRNPPPIHRPPPEPEIAPSFPPSLPGRNPPTSKPPPEPENVRPTLPGRIPPSHRPPPEPENSLPSLPSRNPGSHRLPPPEVENSVPSLPSRNPPSHRPPPELDTFGPPSLPGRNPPSGQIISEPHESPPPAVPDRPRKRPGTRTRVMSPGHSLPPDLPASRPPNIPKRIPDPPMPSGGEPLLPSRPTKLSGGDSPAKFSWYHANLDRKRAEAMLRKYGKDGTYIVRDSTKVSGEYSLSLWFGGGIRHLRIRLRPDKKFVLGEEKSDENSFSTVMELVDHHKQQPLHLKSGGETLLRFECPH